MAKAHFIPVPGEDEILSDYIAAAVGSGGPETDICTYETVFAGTATGDTDICDWEA